MNLTNIPKVKIIDYGIGNIWSVMSAFKYLGVEVEIVSDPEEISMSSILVLPGVGSFRKCMESLMNSGIDKAVIEAVSNKDAKILGVCLGMQLMGSCSTEDGKTKGLNLLPNRVEKFTSQELNFSTRLGSRLSPLVLPSSSGREIYISRIKQQESTPCWV